MPAPEDPAGAASAAPAAARSGATAAAAPAATPARTRLFDAAHRGPWFEGPDLVTALRIYDEDVEYELPPALAFTLGASRRCDVPVRGRDLSARHCAFVRTGTQLRVYDQRSTNGLFAAGRRVDAIDLYPGDTFTAPPLTFIAMNQEMRAARPLIADLIGAGAAPTPDSVLIDAVKLGHHLLITGEAGCEMDRLARALHAVSLRRGRELIELAEPPGDRGAQRVILARAARSTLLLRLELMKAPLDPTFCAMAFSPDRHVRVIATAPSAAAARRALGGATPPHLEQLGLRPLALRTGELPALLDHLLAERGAGFGFAELAAPNREALRRHGWRDNFAGLRLAADRLVAIGRVRDWEAMTWHERSAALGVPKTTLFDWFTSLGLAVPLLGA